MAAASSLKVRRVGSVAVVSGLPKARRKPSRRTDAMILGMPRWLAYSLLVLLILSCIGVH